MKYKKITFLISFIIMQPQAKAGNINAFDGKEVTIQGGTYVANNYLGAAIASREGKLFNTDNELSLINTRGTEGGYGANLEDGGEFSSPDQKLNINVTSSGTSIGVRATNRSVFDFSNSPVIVNVSSNSVKSGYSAYGFSLMGQDTLARIGNNSKVIVDNVASAAYGIQAYGGSEFIAGKNLELNVSSQNKAAGGIIARSNGKITVGDNFTANTSSSGDIAYSVWAYTKGAIAIGNNAIINAVAKGSGNSAQGIVARDLANITVGKELVINTSSENDTAIGIHIYDQDSTGSNNNTGAKATIGEGLYIEATSINANAYGIVSSGTGSNTTINGGSIIATIGDKYGSGDALLAFDHGTINANAAKYNIYGNVINNGGSITLALDEGSYLNGAVIMSGKGINNLTLAGTTWNMTGDSHISSLSFGGSESAINFSGKNADGSTVYNKLSIDNLSGDNGHFYMRSSISEGLGDYINIMNGSGSHKVSLLDSGVEITQPKKNSLDLITDSSGKTIFSLASINGTKINAVDGGTYMYHLNSRLEAEKGTIWYLSADKNGSTSTTTPSTDAILSMASAPQLIFNNELNNLRYRKGSLQDNEEAAGAWVRTIGNKTDVSADHANFKLEQGGLELGVDNVVDYESGKAFFGGFSSYGNINVKHQRGGISKVDSYSVGLYATYFDQAGFYVDGVLKYNHFKNDLQARSTNGSGIFGNYNQNAIGGAVEVGYNTTIADSFWVEPYTKMSYVQVQGKDVKLNNGMKANVDHQDSLNTELGVNVGMSFNVGQHSILSPYFKVAWTHEYIDDNSTVINERNRFNTDLSGDVSKVGIGVNASLSKQTTLFAEVDYSKGNKIETPVMGNLGLRYNF